MKNNNKIHLKIRLASHTFNILTNMINNDYLKTRSLSLLDLRCEGQVMPPIPDTSK